jgi:SulP family sulfate permease
VVADGMAGTRHRSNTELIAQGIANLATPLFGGIPATGAIARTATNVRNGGRTPVAGIVHAGVLLLIIVAFARWAEHIPMAALAGILLVVAYNMSEWRVFLRLFRSPRSDVLVLLTTFGLTVAVDLVVALQVGMVLAAFLFMRRMAALTDVGYLRDMLHEEEETAADRNPAARRDIPPGVEVFDLHGPLFFGAASAFKDAIHQIARPPRVLILRLREVPAIDATGLRALEDLVDKAAADGTAVVLSGMQRQPSAAIERSGITAKVGRDNVQDTFAAALERARALAAAGD